MKSRLFLIAALGALLLAAGCQEIDPPVPEGEEPLYKRTLMVCNEGVFLSNNASLSTYIPETKRFKNNVFYDKNEVPLGDVFNSLTLHNGLAYAVINNSGVVYVFDAYTYALKGKIAGLSSPRHFYIINDEKAYVTDIVSKTIAIVNPKTFEKIGSIDVGASTEQMAIKGNYGYVVNWSMGNKVFKIDLREDKLVGTLTVPLQPNSVVVDKNGAVWVLSDGGYPGIAAGQVKPAFTLIEPESFTVMRTLEFPNVVTSPCKMTINKAKDLLFFLNSGMGGFIPIDGGIYAMPITANRLPDLPIIAENDKVFNNYLCDPYQEDEFYIAHSPVTGSVGEVIRVEDDGKPIDHFDVGFYPGFMVFRDVKVK